MIEVKSSTSVKDYHREDVAVQAFVRGAEVQRWIEGAQSAIAQATAPAITIGKQCHDPYPCGFYAHCQSQVPQAEHPIAWLPGRLSTGLVKHITNEGITELRDVPDHLLNAQQQRVKNVTLTSEAYFDQAGAAQALAPHTLPAYFLDFETIMFAVPLWQGTRPYQQVPFQFSVHRLSDTAQLNEQSFIDLSGKDPSEAFAQALLALTARLVDLLPIAREYYYHPSQQGSWSIKAVLPALCPDAICA